MATHTDPRTHVPSPLIVATGKAQEFVFDLLVPGEEALAYEFSVLLRDLIRVAKFTGAAESLEALSTVARERGDIGQPGSPDVGEWLAWCALAARVEVDPDMEGAL